MDDEVRILVPVDGSEGACRAMDTAVSLAQAVGASLDILYVSYFDSATDSEEEDSWLPDIVTRPSGREAKAILTQARQRVPDSVPVTVHQRTGIPAQEIVAFSREQGVRLIVVGGRGLGVVEGFLLGSVSQQVMEEAEASVLIVK